MREVTLDRPPTLKLPRTDNLLALVQDRLGVNEPTLVPSRVLIDNGRFPGDPAGLSHLRCDWLVAHLMADGRGGP